MTYFIKSTICLVVLYGFYHLILRHQKILLFNRFYLIISLLFSLIIPLIVIPIKSNITIYGQLEKFTLSTTQLVQGKTITESIVPSITYLNVLMALFLVISIILMTRFVLNIVNIMQKIQKGKKVNNQKTSFILIQEKTLPYSFFKYIFVNQSDFEKGEIEKELLLHEEAHCLQYHSIDMVFIELINIFLWFNPVIWLYRKSIQLNHEFYADSRVLMERDPFCYQQVLLNVILRNNSNFLVSNFKYSFIKNRIIMMTKSNPGHSAFLRKLSSFLLFFIMALTLTFSQEITKVDLSKKYDNEWWFPLLQKHNIDLKKYTFMGNYKPISGDSIGYTALELGYNAIIDKKTLTLKDPIFIIKENEDVYNFIVAKFASHNLVTNEYKWGDGKLDEYKFKSIDLKPTQSFSFDTLLIDSKTHKALIKNVKGVVDLKNNHK